MSPVIAPPPVYAERRTRIASRLLRIFGFGHRDEPAPLPSRKVGPRRPVEHGPTKAPFSRVHRRRMRLIARHSRARNRR